jgi:hypothetical protein
LNLDDEAPRASVADAERAQNKQGDHLYSRTRLSRVFGRLCKRTDQAFEQSARQRRRGEFGILVGEVSTVDSGHNVLFEFGREGPAVAESQYIDLSIDWLTDDGPGEPAVPERASSEGSDCRGESRQRPGRDPGGASNRR